MPGPLGALACPHCCSVMDRTEMPETPWVACSCCFLASGKCVMEKDKTQPLVWHPLVRQWDVLMERRSLTKDGTRSCMHTDLSFQNTRSNQSSHVTPWKIYSGSFHQIQQQQTLFFLVFSLAFSPLYCKKHSSSFSEIMCVSLNSYLCL